MQGIGIAKYLLRDNVKKRLGENSVALRDPSGFTSWEASRKQVSKTLKDGKGKKKASYKIEA